MSEATTPPTPRRRRTVREGLREWLDELTDRLFPQPEPDPIPIPVRRR